MNGRAVFTRCSRSASDPSTAPPCAPSALDSVMVTATCGDPARPSSCTSPRPPPATPIPCASSTSSSAFSARQSAASSASGAWSPHTEYTDSTTTTARASARSASSCATCATSECRAIRTGDWDSRAPSTRDACAWASETISVSASPSAVSTPVFAAYPLENASATGWSVSSHSSRSSTSWTPRVPVTSREAREPVPCSPSACWAAATTRGSRESPR